VPELGATTLPTLKTLVETLSLYGSIAAAALAPLELPPGASTTTGALAKVVPKVIVQRSPTAIPVPLG
jgi:hypothetical protein